MNYFITEENLKNFENDLLNLGKKTATVTKYVSNLKTLQKYLNNQEVTTELLQGYGAWLKEQGYHTRSINLFFASANSFFEYMKWDKFFLSPLRLSADEMNKDQEVLTEEEYRRLFQMAMERQDDFMVLLMKVLGQTQLRVTELELLTTDVVREGKIYLTRKNEKVCYYLPKALQEELATYIQKYRITEGIVFRTSSGKVFHRSNVVRKIKELCVYAGIDPDKGSVRSLKRGIIPDLSDLSGSPKPSVPENEERTVSEKELPEESSVEACAEKITQMKEEIRKYEEHMIWLQGEKTGREEGAARERVQSVKHMIELGIQKKRILKYYTDEEYREAREN